MELHRTQQDGAPVPSMVAERESAVGPLPPVDSPQEQRFFLFIPGRSEFDLASLSGSRRACAFAGHTWGGIRDGGGKPGAVLVLVIVFFWSLGSLKGPGCCMAARAQLIKCYAPGESCVWPPFHK